MEIRYKPEETPVTLAAKNSYVGRVFLDWAKYPITETEASAASAAGLYGSFSGPALCGDPTFAESKARRTKQDRRIDKNLRIVGDVYETPKGRVVVPEPGQH